MAASTDSAGSPRFSIVVPCHASRAWLRPCLDSVLSQSCADFEIIAVDDASPDGSDRILDEYAAADPRVRVLHLSENVGLGLARNAGLKECRGDYVLFLDADDTYRPGSLEAIARRIEATGRPDIVMFDYERIHWDGRVVRNQRHDAFAREGDGVFTAAERPVFLTFLEVVWNKAIRRDFLTLHGFVFTAGFYEDAPWTYSTMLTAERIATLDQVVVHYRQHRTGGNIHATATRQQFDIFDQYDRVHAFITSDPALAGWRRFAFDRSLDHILAVLDKPERVHPDDRAEFFHAAAAFAKRWKPEGYVVDRTRRGFRRWQIVHDDYATYCTLKLSAKVLSVPSPRKAVGKLLHRDLDPNLALYGAYWFKQYACNPRAIYEKATELAPQLRGVWVIDADHVAAIPEGVEYVVAGSPAYAKLCAKATYFISNMNLPKELEKREGQIHLQTQHGTPLKTMGTDLRHYPVAAKDLDLDELMRQVDRWDFNLSANRYSSEIWERTYPAHFEELEYGFPRNDRLVNATLDDVRAIRASFGFDDSHLVVFYAPTFRDGVDSVRTPSGLVDLGGDGIHLDLDRLAAAAGEHGRVLVRTHYSLSKHPSARSPRVVDVSEHPRVEDLMLAADVLISDYSSISFDYANLDRPIVLLVDDLGSYDHNRGTYFDITAFPPGLVARSPEELLSALQTGAFAKAEAAKHRQLFREKFCEFDDGRAAERVVRRLFLGETDLPPITPLADRHPAPSPHRL
ncbi:bifunctional glycosyltransferase/CDP-glycerol:glycerophosphate glycerophosphotransferase [Kribbella sp. CA-293567]|uniref:bifunctional glycosyltransferase/CDP-glycerol:glycerophosphate glycerophosphotransferase n=1 Tax=Kribbella sp. CA-293567 TaxID=3002436 RepID=UPI0022DD132D|nr:bifunctional glycosyltransferase family 2 protein/CDP-glycerol:glycerophosphate glycerophosphotransferase [Kribbella sp. CA-293567]WBQ04924.1 bifunctional glycosyltransferase family 2 protein/CDP-glycerol:glycerophosphate glycerophosphotransferase [Kribbella sp. CA-293567]